MLNSQLKRLTDPCTLVGLDLRQAPLHLLPTENGLLSYYAGQYLSGGVTIAGETIERPVSVSANELRELVKLLDPKAEASLTCAPTMLVIKSANRRLTLRYHGDARPPVFPEGEGVRIASVSRREFATEAAFVLQTVAPTTTTPLLTGVRLISDGTRLGVQTMNGSSLLYQSILPSTGAARGEATVSPKELVAALKIVSAPGVVRLGMHGRKFVLGEDDSFVHLSTYSGDWPKFVRKREFDDRLVVQTAVLRMAARAATALKTSGWVAFKPENEGVTIATQGTGLGQFAETIPGALKHTYVLSAGDLSVAAQLDADEVTLQLGSAMALISAGARTLTTSLRLL